MKAKILLELKTKYSSLGLSGDVLEGVADQLALFVKEESEIATAVTGAEKVLKSFQSYADSRVNSFRTEAEKSKAEAERLKAEAEKKKEPKGDETEIGKLTKAMEAMQATMTALQTQNLSGALKTNIINTLKEKGVSETFYNTAMVGREFTKQEDATSFIESVTSGYEAHKQELANQGFDLTKQPEEGSGKTDGNEIAKMVDEETKELTKTN